MDPVELQKVVDAIVEYRRLGELRPHELVASLHRKTLSADSLPIIEPLLYIHREAVYKYAIDIVGKMKHASAEASEAIEAAWERSWQHGVPQACKEAFRALLKIGNNDARLLLMIERAMKVDNYGIHKECAQTLMKIRGGDALLANWNETIPGKCCCQLHQKLAAKVAQYVATA